MIVKINNYSNTLVISMSRTNSLKDDDAYLLNVELQALSSLKRDRIIFEVQDFAPIDEEVCNILLNALLTSAKNARLVKLINPSSYMLKKLRERKMLNFIEVLPLEKRQQPALQYT